MTDDFSPVVPQSRQGFGGWPALGVAAAIVGVGALTWARFAQAQPSLDARTRDRLAPRERPRIVPSAADIRVG